MYLLNSCWRPGSVWYISSTVLYLFSVFFTNKKTEVQRGYLLTQSLETKCSLVGWGPRFVLTENSFPCPCTILRCNFQKLKITVSDEGYASSSLNKELPEHKGCSEMVTRRGRGSGKASPRMWHLSWAMLNSWSQSCWITNVLIFWLHLLGTYQSHKVKEAIILLWPPKLLKWSHLLFLHPLVSHREFLK